MSSAHLTPPDLMSPRGANQAFEIPSAPANEYNDFRYRPPARGVVRPEPIATAITGYVVLMGFGVRETTGQSTATLVMRNGMDANGLEVMPIIVSPGGSAREWFGPHGIHLDVGYFLQVVAGTVSGSVLITDASITAIDYLANSEWPTSR